MWAKDLNKPFTKQNAQIVSKPLKMSQHQKLHTKPTSHRHLLGDLHSCLSLLQSELQPHYPLVIPLSGQPMLLYPELLVLCSCFFFAFKLNSMRLFILSNLENFLLLALHQSRLPDRNEKSCNQTDYWAHTLRCLLGNPQGDSPGRNTDFLLPLNFLLC